MKASLCAIAFLLVFAGQIQCCPIGTTCNDVKETQDCNKIPPSTCNIYGDTHYNTFDNGTYEFQGTCTYTVAQGCHLDGTNLTLFSVVVENERWDEIQETPNVTMAKVVVVEVSNMTIVLRRNQLHQVMINGILTNIPVNLNEGEVIIQQEGDFNVILTNFGLRVAYDMVYHVIITVPGTYAGKTCGMCGNFNGNKSDELMLPNGKETTDLKTFGAAWKVAVPGVVCDDGCSGDFCPKCPQNEKHVFEKDCSIITDPNGPFAACHKVIAPNSYFRDCVYDVCMTEGEEHMLCHSIAAYMRNCQNFGVPIKNWRTSTFCPLSCPPNTVYEICAKACDTPCPGLTGVMECNVQTCLEGCMCKPGFFNNGTGCITADQCGCYDNGQTYKAGETIWGNDECTRKCTCNPTNGQVQCVDTSCPIGTSCSVVKGIQDCHKVPTGTCNIYGDPHYNTFDNGIYDFQGTCTYTATQGCHLEGTKLTPFSVVIENERWSEIQQTPNVSMAKVVVVEVDDMTIILRRNQKHQVMINGTLTNIPVNINEGEVIIQQEGDFNVILTNFGLRVAYNMVYHVIITVPGTYAGKTCGMCGNFNGNKNDDLLLPNGKETKDLKTFGAAWKVAVPGVVCDDGCSGDFCPKCPQNEKHVFEKDCSIITDPNGPFAACHKVIAPDSYFRDCVYDVCITEGDEHMLCHSIAAYMRNCQNFGVPVKNWRTSTFCPLSCPPNTVYEICAKACDAPCPGLTGVFECNIQTCLEACTCKPGFFNNGTGCVTADQCGCYDRGHTYKLHETVVTENCQERLTCLPTGKIQWQNMSCESSEVCTTKNGVRGCYPKQCMVEAGGSFSLFSGETWNITSIGAYELVKACDGALEEEWFRVVVALGSQNSVVAVYVYFEEVFITVTNKHSTWINGKLLTLPQKLKNEVMVELVKDSLIIEKKGILRVSFSLSLGLKVSVSDGMAPKVCGVCGSDDKIFAVQPQSVQEFMAKWRALDFPNSLC